MKRSALKYFMNICAELFQFLSKFSVWKFVQMNLEPFTQHTQTFFSRAEKKSTHTHTQQQQQKPWQLLTALTTFSSCWQLSIVLTTRQQFNRAQSIGQCPSSSWSTTRERHPTWKLFVLCNDFWLRRYVSKLLLIPRVSSRNNLYPLNFYAKVSLNILCWDRFCRSLPWHENHPWYTFSRNTYHGEKSGNASSSKSKSSLIYHI